MNYDTAGLRDPFVSPMAGRVHALISGMYGVEELSDIQLEGLILDPRTGSYIIANGVLMREGQVEADVKVLEIRKNGVVFEIRGIKGFKQYRETNGGT